MIITEQKPAEEILEMLADYDSVFIVGCGENAPPSARPAGNTKSTK